jgi:integrase
VGRQPVNEERASAAAEKTGDSGMLTSRFRHANASLMDELSVPMKVRQRRLGHSDPRLTMNVYAHMASADDERIAEQLGEMLYVVGQKQANEGSKEKGPALRQALVN